MLTSMDYQNLIAIVQRTSVSGTSNARALVALEEKLIAALQIQKQNEQAPKQDQPQE